FLIGAGCRDDGNVHSSCGVDLLVADLREDELLFDTDRIVATTIEGFRRKTPEVLDARQSYMHELCKKIVHSLSAERNRDAHRISLSHFVVGDRFASAVDYRFLTGDGGQIFDTAVDDLGV